MPNIIIAHTIKGKGLLSLEDKNEWLYQTPRENEIAEAKEKGLV
jgi:transketolase